MIHIITLLWFTTHSNRHFPQHNVTTTAPFPGQLTNAGQYHINRVGLLKLTSGWNPNGEVDFCELGF